jgi:hypothetical protein
MKITRGVLRKLEERVNEMEIPTLDSQPKPNPQKISEAVFEGWEVNYVLSYLNEGLARGGFKKRAFPRRVGNDPRQSGDEPGIGMIDEDGFQADPPEFLIESDEHSEPYPGNEGEMEIAEDLAPGIMDDGYHLFEIWVIDWTLVWKEDIDIGRDVFYRMVAQGYQDIFGDTEIEDWFYMG